MLFEVLTDRVYRHLFAAQATSLIGTGLMTVALGLLAYDLAGDRASVVLGTALGIKMCWSRRWPPHTPRGGRANRFWSAWI